MSYEGTNHKLCAVGHYSAVDALADGYYGDRSDHCRCGEPFVAEFSQDYTNGSDPKCPETMPPKLRVKKPPRGKTCNLGHFHETEPARHYTPRNGLWRKYVGGRS